MEKVKVIHRLTRNGDFVDIYKFPKGGLYRYTHDGDYWQWWVRDNDYVYYCTDENGEGVYRIDHRRNSRQIYAGTDQFSVHGLSEKYAKHKILDFMKNNLMFETEDEYETDYSY